jgi:sporulation protein YlmC with PRC-barrel domain
MKKITRPLPELAGHGRLLDARLHLLDHQLVDADGDPVGTVDDLELDGLEVGTPIETDSRAPRITAIMSGQVFATRILGGGPPPSRFQSIPWHLVDRVGVVTRLAEGDIPSDSQWLERWLRDHVIAHIPGGRHAS